MIPHRSPQDTMAIPASRHMGGPAAPCRHRCDPECRSDHQFLGMCKAFESTGGLLPLHEAVRHLREMGGPDADELVKCIARRTVITFDWRYERWLPMFQFSRQSQAVHESLLPVLRELSAVYDGWETASWFALPNTWLRQRIPVDMLLHDLPAVWYAARVDRFIALGEATWDKQALPEKPRPLSRQQPS